VVVDVDDTVLIAEVVVVGIVVVEVVAVVVVVVEVVVVGEGVEDTWNCTCTVSRRVEKAVEAVAVKEVICVMVPIMKMYEEEVVMRL
jgi:hypothetical protein